MNSEDLWGDLPETDDATDPVTVLRQQASLLGSKTKQILTGVVSRPAKRNRTLADRLHAPGRPDEASSGLSKQDEMMEVRFLIRCSVLDNYMFHVLTLNYPLLTVFPMQIVDETTGRRHVCKSVDELRTVLQQILGSSQLRRVISALLREAKAMAS